MGPVVMPAAPAMAWGQQFCPGTVREGAVRVLLPKVRENRMPGIPGGRTEIEIMETRAGTRP